LQSTMPFQKSWRFFGMTQLSSLPLVKPAGWLKSVFKSAKRLSLLKTQAFVVRNVNNYLRRPNLAISAV
jgi:hypothetical protein